MLDLGCGSDSHVFTAADGAISVTLLATNPATSLMLVVCPPVTGAVPLPADCTFYNKKIDIGQTLEARRKGGPQQNVWFFPLTCGIGPPSLDSFGYRASVTYVK